MKNQTLTYLIVALSFSISCSNSDEPEAPPSGEGIFETQVENGTIEGELFLPTGDGPFPVLIIVPGSGNSPKEEAAAFAPEFNSFGYALYVYNKRGIGGSTGSYPVETIENPTPFLQARAEDVKGIISFLKTHTDIKQDQIGLFGSSQGTWVNCLVYNDTPADLSQIIMASGGATSTGHEHYYEQLIEQGLSVEEANQRVADFDGNTGFDPMPILDEITVPVLFIFGALDNSHPTLYDRDLLLTLTKLNYTVHLYHQANHELIEVNTGELPDVLFENIQTWLEETAP